MVYLVGAGRHPLNEVASCLSQPNTTGATLEKEDSEIFLQYLDAAADTGLCDTEHISGMTKAQTFGDGECLN